MDLTQSPTALGVEVVRYVERKQSDASYCQQAKTEVLWLLQRAARSQISTAVSFEGARAAGSAALPSRSLEEESALSAAAADGTCGLGFDAS